MLGRYWVAKQGPDESVELVLRAALERSAPARLHDALIHAVFGGGARVRPRLTLAVARAIDAREPSPLTLASAAAVELVHCASLVHDDLPCFDDAATRRGRPTVHSLYGEACAVLVGDALIIAAFETLAQVQAPSSFFLVLAQAAGAKGGLVSGQALELEDGPIHVTTCLLYTSRCV